MPSGVQKDIPSALLRLLLGVTATLQEYGQVETTNNPDIQKKGTNSANSSQHPSFREIEESPMSSPPRGSGSGIMSPGNPPLPNQNPASPVPLNAPIRPTNPKPEDPSFLSIAELSTKSTVRHFSLITIQKIKHLGISGTNHDNSY